ncbi:hypothetical protein GCM10022262_33310 [Georgenia daeguensis]|uniref:Uncharacterized protein n=1 Tax=Georgenia daeguensis TaxID=908355 RepID=A0ABP8EYD0_9MICO
MSGLEGQALRRRAKGGEWRRAKGGEWRRAAGGERSDEAAVHRRVRRGFTDSFRLR